MVHAGYVERVPCPTDRRVQFVALTAAGREMLQRATEVHLDGIQRHMIARLRPDEVAVLDDLLRRLAQAD
jgi:DNA-binding MarR family transcriptional regulator